MNEKLESPGKAGAKQLLMSGFEWLLPRGIS